MKIFLFVLLMMLLASPAHALLYAGGSGRGESAGNASTGEWVEISSVGQIFDAGDGATGIAAITVRQVIGQGGGGINTADDIRVVIPSGRVAFVWDTGETTATITGGASGKVSTTVSYEDGGRTLVINVTSDFNDGDAVTISGLSFVIGDELGGEDHLFLEIDNAGTTAAFDPYAKTVNNTANTIGGSGRGEAAGEYEHIVILYQGGAGRGEARVAVSDVDVVFISSAAQTFDAGDPPEAAAAITIMQKVGASGGGINAADDIRVRIPAAFQMVFDSAQTAVTVQGAVGKVSATVSYEDAGKTLVISVTDAFANDELVVISGPVFENFDGASSGFLALEIDNAGTVAAVDGGLKSIRIEDILDEAFYGGAGRGETRAGVFRALRMLDGIGMGIHF